MTAAQLDIFQDPERDDDDRNVSGEGAHSAVPGGVLTTALASRSGQLDVLPGTTFEDIFQDAA